MKRILKGLMICFFALQLQACGESEIPDPNPGGGFGGVDFKINITDSKYTALQKEGGSAIVTDKKVIVARLNSVSWSAVQSYCPSDVNTNLTFNASDMTYRCSKDNSVYEYNGKAKSGSSTNLKLFNTTFNNNSQELRIFE